MKSSGRNPYICMMDQFSVNHYMANISMGTSKQAKRSSGSKVTFYLRTVVGIGIFSLIPGAGVYGASAERGTTEAASLQTTVRTAPPGQDIKTEKLSLKNGTELYGELVRIIDGHMTFREMSLGELRIDLGAIKEFASTQRVSVLRIGERLGSKTTSSDTRSGTITIRDGELIVSSSVGGETILPVGEVHMVVRSTEIDGGNGVGKSFFSGWSGAATAGAGLMQAAQNSYNYDGSLSLSRRMPGLVWLPARNRTTLSLAGAAGRITQPEYTNLSGTLVDEQVTKTNLLHARIQRDQYFSGRAYYFGTAQFDHNYSQNLQLQQLYGAGLGYTVFELPAQSLDITANIQYVRQSFMNAAPGDNKDLIGSTISLAYGATLTRGIQFNQYVAYLPAFNDGDAYSLISRNTLSLPAYRGFRIALGSINSYLNSVSQSEPPSKRNSFQFTFGLGYDINR